MYHLPALLAETLEGLAVRCDGVYLDGTLGGGGHFGAIVARLDERGTAVGLDRDPDALDNARRTMAGHKARVVLEQERFSRFDTVLQRNGIDGLDGALLDLGVSSHQIDTPDRGFSYQADGPLDMRMDTTRGVTAAQLIRDSDMATLTRILAEYGEVRNAGRMAAVLCACASKGELQTTSGLRHCLEAEYGPLEPSILAKVYQALRIAVNGELDELQEFLGKITGALKTGGRLAIISYHSLEDRLVKNAIRDRGGRCSCPPHQPICTCARRVELKRVTTKAVQAGAEEISRNRRSRSARLRVAQKVS